MELTNSDEYWIVTALKHYEREVLFFDVDKDAIKLVIKKIQEHRKIEEEENAE